jgi:hypothetical protein
MLAGKSAVGVIKSGVVPPLWSGVDGASAGWCGVKKVGFGFAGRAAGGGISSESVGAGVSAAPVLKVST